MRLRMPRICAQGISGCAVANSLHSLTMRAAASPIVIRLRTTACWVRRSVRNSSLDTPSHIGVPAALLPTCERGSYRGALSPHRRSYRKCFPQHLLTRTLGQVSRRQKIYSDAEQILERDLESAQIKERGARERINQKIQVAVLAIPPMQDRPEYPRIAGSALLNQAADFGAMKMQRSGRLHGAHLDSIGWDGFYPAISTCALLHFHTHKSLILLMNRESRCWLSRSSAWHISRICKMTRQIYGHQMV